MGKNRKDEGGSSQRKQYDGFLKDSDDIIEDTISDLSHGPAENLDKLLSQKSPLPVTTMIMRVDILMTYVRLLHCITPETVDERARAIAKFIGEKGIKEGKLQILKYGQGTILLESHESITYATSWYGKVSKKEMKLSHKAVKKIHEHLARTILEAKPLPNNFYNLICRAYDIKVTPPQEEVVYGDYQVMEGPPEESVKDTVESIMSKVTFETKKTPAGATETKVFQALSSLPRGIPTELWGKPLEELVDQIMVAEHATSEKGDFVMDLEGTWYFANPEKMNTFLQSYHGTTTRIKRAKAIPMDEEGPPTEGDVKAEIKYEIKKGERKGFDVTALNKALEFKDPMAQKELEAFRKTKKMAESLLTLVEDLDSFGVEKEVQEISNSILMFKDLDKAKKDLYFLERKIKSQDSKRKERLEKLKKEVDEIQARGFSVPHLFRLLQTENIKLIEEGLQKFEREEAKLKSLEKRAHHLSDQGFDFEIEEIKRHFGDPSKIPHIEAELGKLEDELKMEEERQRYFEDIDKKMKGWEKQGFKTTNLQKVMSKDMGTIQDALKIFEGQVKRMIKFEVILDELRGKGFDKEVDDLRLKITDVDNLSVIGTGINTIKARIGRKKQTEGRKKVLRKGLEKWRGEGWDVTSLEPAFSKDIESLEKTFSEFQEMMDITSELLEFLGPLEVDVFEDEVKKIRYLAKNPNNFEKVNLAIEALEKVVSEYKESLKPSMPKIISKGELVNLIENLPKGLPNTLWGRSVDKLATQVLSGPFGNTPDKKVVVRITRRWYYYEPQEPDKLLQPYEGEVKKVEVEIQAPVTDIATPAALAGASGSFIPSRQPAVEDDVGAGRIPSTPSWAKKTDEVHRPSGSKEEMRRRIKGRRDKRTLDGNAISQFNPINYPFELTEIEILEKITTLPRGLPSGLWMSDMEALALKILNSDYAKTPRGLVVVCVDGEWYYGNPNQPGRYLQVYRG